MTKVSDKICLIGGAALDPKVIERTLNDLRNTVVEDIPFAPNLVAGIMADAASVIDALNSIPHPPQCLGARLFAWWRRPPLRQRILNALSETEWSIGLDITRRAKIHPFKTAAMYFVLLDLENEGLVESRPGPLSSDHVNRHRKYRKTRQ